MSQQQLDVIINDLQAVFSTWGDVSLAQMRREWDEVFSKSRCDVGAKIEKIDAGGVPALRVTAKGAQTNRVVLYYHGGGYIFGSPTSHQDLGEYLSQAAQSPVILLDYRLAPENPFPAAIDDARAAYRWLLDSGFKPEQIAIAGDSAGGNLVFTSLFSIRQHQLPLPACAVPLSPWTDMECTGETFITKADVDPMVHKAFTRKLSDLYAPGANLRDPLVSPLYGDLKGLPPLLIQVGDRETLLDDSRRIAERARQAGVDVTLEIEPGQVHVFQIFAARLDEGRAAIVRMGDFIRKHTHG